jgi:hypothetical protein
MIMKKEEIMLNTQLPEPTQFEIDIFNQFNLSPKYIVKYREYLLNNNKKSIPIIKRYGYFTSIKQAKKHFNDLPKYYSYKRNTYFREFIEVLKLKNKG